MGLLERLATTLAGLDDLSDDQRGEIERALAEESAGDAAAAEKRLLAAAARHKDVPAIFVALGEIRVRAGRDEAAVEAFGRAVDLSGQSVDGWLGLGEALIRLGRFEPAREALRKVLARTSEVRRRARAHAGRGRIALALDEPARAVRELREAASLAPLDHAIAHDLGLALLQEGDREASSWLARAAHADQPEPAWVLDAARAAPTRDAALALLRAGLDVVSADDSRPEARAQLEAALARALCQPRGAGRDEAAAEGDGDAEPAAHSDEAAAGEAMELARAAIERASSDPVGHEALSIVHEAAGRIDTALAAAERALALGGTRDLPRLLRLGLAAADRGAIARVAQAAVAEASAAPPSAAGATAALAQAALAFVEGRARDDDLVQLGLLADRGGATSDAEAQASRIKRFVAEAASPGAVPRGNLYALLSYARALATDNPALGPLLPLAARAVEAFDRPLLVAVMGEFNAGKSSFVNALCGEAVAEVGVTPTTATINVLRYGPRGGRVLYHDGRAEELPPAALRPFLAALDDAGAAAIRTVEIFMPLDLLRRVEIVDTPGLNSLRPEHEAIARGFLTDADAIVWLFSVNQAAKATERDALALAQAAGKRVLGVLNKADQASADEIAEIEGHVTGSLGDLLEVLIPFSARRALQAQGRARSGGSAGAEVGAGTAEDGGMAALQQALEQRFFSHARALKRKTALGALGRFVAEARGLLTAVPDVAADDHDGEATLAALAAREETLKGTIASLRVATRARIEAGFRQAGAELAELFEPRRHRILGDRGPGPDEDRRFLFDLLEDAVFEATFTAARALEAAAAGGPAVPIDVLVGRFRAYARGLFRGGVVDQILRMDAGVPLLRTDVHRIGRALIAAVPDVDAELFTPLLATVTGAFAAAVSDQQGAQRRRELRALIREERVGRPLRDLGAALAEAAGDETT
jgi:GTP-binding protein EngB required for normal cell division/Tfp pilus assembly protein PilF